jgi:6-phosphogluconolactonase
MSLRIEHAADLTVVVNLGMQRIEAAAAAALRERGRFVAVVSGDTLALSVCKGWAERGRVDFTKVVLVLADDRAVTLADPGSRRAALQAAVVDRIASRSLPVPEVLAVEAEATDRTQAAAAFDRVLRGVLPSCKTELVLLGVGRQGEVAGLTPGDPVLRESDAWCISSASGAVGTGRFTLTLPLLTKGRATVLVAEGVEMAPALQRTLQGPLDPEQVPAQFFLRDERLAVTLVADEGSRSLLKPG